MAALGDEVFVSDRSLIKPTLQDLPNAGGLASLGGQRDAGGMRSHRMVEHCPPSGVYRQQRDVLPCILGSITSYGTIVEHTDDFLF